MDIAKVKEKIKALERSIAREVMVFEKITGTKINSITLPRMTSIKNDPGSNYVKIQASV